jgi:hypothetical protein
MNKPSVTRTNHILPFSELSPAQFERLCLWLVEHEGYAKAERLGEAGSEQGRDVVAYLEAPTGKQMWYFQCKRYQTISAATLIKEVQKYNALAAADPAAKPFGIVFVTNSVLSAAARKQVKKSCVEHGYECEFWARTELDRKAKKHEDILGEFFDRARKSDDHSARFIAKGDRSININVYGNLTGGNFGIDAGDPAEAGRSEQETKGTPASKSGPLSEQRVSISRLPATSGSDLFGREAELKLLDDAWADPKTNIIAFDAFGGVGKTSLTSHWLKRLLTPDNYRGAERVCCWSFILRTKDHCEIVGSDRS